MTPLVLGFASAAVTLAGGLAALRFDKVLELLMSLAAGIVVGVAVFDLLPEAITAAGQPGLRSVMVAVAVGFGTYLLLDRSTASALGNTRRWRRHLTPATLALHSVVDGLGIGLAFQADPRAGWLVGIAVLTHDFADGVNTVGLTQSAASIGAARRWLAINAAAPVIGVLLSQALHPTLGSLALLLAAFAGAFLYIGACELLPRSRALSPGLRNAAVNVAGLALMAVVTGLVW